MYREVYQMASSKAISHSVGYQGLQRASRMGGGLSPTGLPPFSPKSSTPGVAVWRKSGDTDSREELPPSNTCIIQWWAAIIENLSVKAMR